ncbi:MAG: DUF2183 domain-containing protein [Kofleriaceae bacterium]|nr:DUF2183 domain-containing protein [Kofleriaceae bacterium]
MRSFASLLLSFSLFAACTNTIDNLDGPPGQGGKSDSPFTVEDLIEGTAPAVGLLRFVNDPSTGFDLLNDDARLRSDTAQHIIDHRDGGAELDLFDNIAELDDVPRVGDAALRDLLNFAFDNGFVPERDEELGVYDGVSFSVNQATAVVRLVNTASIEQLDIDFSLDSRAVDSILEVRPVFSVLQLSKLSFVGPSALGKLIEHSLVSREIGILSDLDKTIVPPAASFQELPDDAYPGIAELLNILEFGNGEGAAGDIGFVTARQPESVTEIPQWLADHGIPLGPINTGISGIPFLAKDEKIRDITEAFNASPNQQFIMFGDSSHADPDAYRVILDTFGDKVEAAFIHNVKDIDPARLEGLILIDNYAQAAAELFRIGRLSEDQARMVMLAVIAGGEIDADTMESLIETNRPD